MKDLFFLDLDDTLLDFAAAERANFFQTLTRFGAAPDEALLARFHVINAALWEQLERGGITRDRLQVKRFALLFEEAGISADPMSVSAAYKNNFPEICYPYDGAKDFLARLAARGRVYIVTNGGTAIQTRHVALAGFSPYLSGLFISEEMGCVKPSEEYAAKVIGGVKDFDPARAVLIGDSLTSDMVCAKRMGIAFILFRKGGMPPDFSGCFAQTYPAVEALLEGDGLL